jgi:hypothetical protein
MINFNPINQIKQIHAGAIYATSHKDHLNHNRHVENYFSTMIKWSFLTTIQILIMKFNLGSNEFAQVVVITPFACKAHQGQKKIIDCLELHVVMFDEYLDFLKNKSWTR